MIEKSTENQPQQQASAEARPKSRIQDAVIRLAGNSQDGIQVIGGFLARLAGRTDIDVMTYMTIPATISGGASIYQVRLGTGEILSAGDDVDVLVAFYQHSYNDHIGTLREGGILLYDLDQVQPDATDARHRAIGVPITSLTVEAIGGTAKDKGKNMFVLGLLTRLFDLDRAKLEPMLRNHFDKKGTPSSTGSLTPSVPATDMISASSLKSAVSNHRQPRQQPRALSWMATKRLPMAR